MTSRDSRDRVDEVLDEYKNGLHKSLHAAAKSTGVSRTSLHRRYHGSGNRKTSSTKLLKLYPEEEQAIVKHIRAQTEAGFPIPYRLLPVLGSIVLARREIDAENSVEVGQCWPTRFINRNPEIRSCKPRVMEQLRLHGASAGRVQDWFDIFESVMARPGVNPINVYNMDESGLQIGVLPSSMKRLVSTDVDLPYFRSPQNRESVTSIECISGMGRALSPAIIMRAKSHVSYWYPTEDVDQYRGWHFALSDRGYTDNELGFEWLKNVFDPQTKDVAGDQPRVLVLDGHGSHESIEFMSFCLTNNIFLCRLPAHSSHLTQPLDVGCFSPLKTYYRQELSKVLAGGATSVNKPLFIHLYHLARVKTFTRSNIESAWAGSGLYPFNPSRVISRIPASSNWKSTTPPPATPPATQTELPIHQTPRTSQQAKDISADILSSTNFGSPQRQWFEKLSRAAVGQFAKEAITDHRIEVLTRQNEEARRRRTQLDFRLGNARLTSMEHLAEEVKEREAQEEKRLRKRPATRRTRAAAGTSAAQNVEETFSNEADPEAE